MTRMLFLILLCTPLVASASDELRINQLEQDVRTLQRQVQALTRLVDQLQTSQTRPMERSGVSPSAIPDTPTEWLDAGKWQRLRTGMTELEVISALGPPTSMRAEDGSRVLLYAMEIGTSGFLSGSVTLRDRVVVEVKKPALQ